MKSSGMYEKKIKINLTVNRSVSWKDYGPNRL